MLYPPKFFHKASVNTEVDGREFEALADMADIFLQKVLRETDIRDLTMALKGASGKLMKKIFSNMSNRGAMLLKEDMDYMGSVLKDDIIACQGKMLITAIRLAEAGEIVFPEEGRPVG